MAAVNKVPVLYETENPDILSRNSQITDILELVLDQPLTKNEMEKIVFDFWNKYNNICQKQNQEENNENESNQENDFLELDALCMYMLDYIFKRNGPTLPAISKSLYCYMKYYNLPMENRIDIINGTKNDFVDALREFTNFTSAAGEDILIDALIKCLIDGNFGLSTFLLKFGFVEIPTVANVKSRKIVEKVVDKFNDILEYTFINEQTEGLIPLIDYNALLDLMERSNSSLRRSILTFFLIVVISEFQLKDQIEVDELKKLIENKFKRKLICLHHIFDEMTEINIKFADIEFFILTFLNPLVGADFGMSLAHFSRSTLCQYWDAFSPRSLKDLIRSTIRKNLHNSMTFPEQVNQFHIPVDLKDFLLFHSEDVFDMLKVSHHSRFLEQTVRLFIDGTFAVNMEH